MASDLAPCIAVVGPPGSGKTTFLHLVDQALRNHPDRPMACVVKGNPDGTGRYLFFHPLDQRKELERRVKGKWIAGTTAATVTSWVENARAHLDLVLVDCGGKHSGDNERIFQSCSHYLVVARSFDDAAEEDREGMASWVTDCEARVLAPVVRLRSLWKSGDAEVHELAPGLLEGTFRSDASERGDTMNDGVIAAIVDRILALRRPRSAPPYFDLRLGRDWTLADLPDLGGRGADLDRRVENDGSVVLGGPATPLWAYATAMHRALDRRPDARVTVFDPKVPGGLVEIPAALRADPGSPLADAVRARWEEKGGEGILHLEVSSADRMLLSEDFVHAATLPLPVGAVPGGSLWTSGPMPIWLHLSYQRWLRGVAPGRALGTLDMRLRGVVFGTSPGGPRFEAREIPRAPPRA